LPGGEAAIDGTFPKLHSTEALPEMSDHGEGNVIDKKSVHLIGMFKSGLQSVT
jgi:hypothetical protein